MPDYSSILISLGSLLVAGSSLAVSYSTYRAKFPGALVQRVNTLELEDKKMDDALEGIERDIGELKVQLTNLDRLLGDKVGLIRDSLSNIERRIDDLYQRRR